jgi:hypothetical protein
MNETERVRYARLLKMSDAEKSAPMGTMLRNHLGEGGAGRGG